MDDGSIEVEDFAAAALAIGTLIQETNKTLNGDRATVSVRLKADPFHPGSFETVIELGLSIVDQAKLLVGTEPIKTGQDLLEALGFCVRELRPGRRNRRTAKKQNLGVVVSVPEKGGAPPDPRGGTESQGKVSGKGVEQLVDRCRWAGAGSRMRSFRSGCVPFSVGVSLPGPSDPAGMDVLDSTYEGSSQSKAPRAGGSSPGWTNRRCGEGSGILGRARKSRAHTRGGAASGRGGTER